MTDQLIFLTLADVLDIHLYQLAHFGGSSGIRDLNLLKSAVAMPQMSFGGVMLHKDIYEMAAAYLFHLVENHPFIDGNKRSGAMAAIVFLDVILSCPHPEALPAPRHRQSHPLQCGGLHPFRSCP